MSFSNLHILPIYLRIIYFICFLYKHTLHSLSLSLSYLTPLFTIHLLLSIFYFLYFSQIFYVCISIYTISISLRYSMFIYLYIQSIISNIFILSIHPSLLFLISSKLFTHLVLYSLHIIHLINSHWLLSPYPLPIYPHLCNYHFIYEMDNLATHSPYINLYPFFYISYTYIKLIKINTYKSID